MTHVATKLRNRLLNEPIKMVMGAKTVSIAHLKSLVKNVQKSVHGLNSSDVYLIDRQNFKSFEKIVDERVIKALEESVNNSEATVQYLKICYDITSSYLDFKMSPLDRIFRLFRSVFFLRIWRNFIKNARSLTIYNNFISNNAYQCVEINAKSLIDLIKIFREKNMPHLFIPTICDSQTCEKTFRQFRSMGTVNFTKINYSLFDILHMIGRIEVRNDISYFKLSEKDVAFPSLDKNKNRTEFFELPSEFEINATLVSAKKAAINDAMAFGMPSDGIDIETYEFQSTLNIANEQEEIEEDIDEDCDILYDEDFFENELNTENPDPNSAFTVVIDEDGNESVIRKISLIWMLTEPGVGMSKDRLRRVQVAKKRKSDD